MVLEFVGEELLQVDRTVVVLRIWGVVALPHEFGYRWIG